MTESAENVISLAPMQQSPLLLAMHDPVLHQFISYLAQKRQQQEANPGSHLTIELSRDHVARVRESFRQSILDGERHLHSLSHLLSSLLLEGEFSLHSNVIGVLPTDEERPFHIRERITTETLFSVTDIDLGNHILDNFRYNNNGNWLPLQLSANFVEYIPFARPSSGVNRLTSRVKAEEEVWNKVADEIFALDELVVRDKHLRQYSKFIKDIFGIKIVCESEADCHTVLERLQKITLDGSSMRKVELLGLNLCLSNTPAPLLEFIETKDYLNCHPSKLKKTGWRALKSVATWQNRLFEIQIQPLSNYYLELDHMAGPSHSSFKLQRDRLRDEISSVIPLYGFYRDMLKMLFMQTDVSFEYENATVIIK
jgi:hypothetical protein